MKPYQHHDPIDDQGKAEPHAQVPNNYFKTLVHGLSKARWLKRYGVMHPFDARFNVTPINILPPPRRPSRRNRRLARILDRLARIETNRLRNLSLRFPCPSQNLPTPSSQELAVQ